MFKYINPPWVSPTDQDYFFVGFSSNGHLFSLVGLIQKQRYLPKDNFLKLSFFGAIICYLLEKGRGHKKLRNGTGYLDINEGSVPRRGAVG